MDDRSPASFFDVKDEVEVSTSPPVSEFVSDAFDSCEINEDDLRKEMQLLVLDKEHPNTQQGESFGFTGGWWYLQRSASDFTLGVSPEETADWERELQEELQQYDNCEDHDSQDDNWDREIEEMLKEES